MARRIVGLDLGAYSVKLLRLEAGKQHLKFEVVDAVEEILSPPEVDGPDLLERQREAVAKFVIRGLLECEASAVALAAADGQMRVMAVPFSDMRKIEAVLPGMLESEVPFELSDMVVSWHRQEIDGSSEDDGNKIRLAFGKKQSIGAMLHMLQPLGVDPRQMHLGSAALYELVRELGNKPFTLHESGSDQVSAIIDFGHRATNLCIFDGKGLIFSRSFLRGGERLTQDIAKALDISFYEAETLKHERVDFRHYPSDEIGHKIHQLALAHYLNIAEEVARVLITSKTSEHGIVGAMALVGGAAKALGLEELFKERFSVLDCRIVSLRPQVPEKVEMPSMALALGLALGGLHIHSKDSRFNFRKDEFAWRGELDFLRAKSSPLILWGLVIICSLTILWSANSLVLDKENKAMESQLQDTCTEILGKSDVPAKKCLAMMKEQISARAEIEIPEFTAADVYLKAAQGMPPDLNVVINEMDILEKKVRITAESPSYADIDKVVASWSKIPCFVKVENTGAQPTGGRVKYNLTNDIDCSFSVPREGPIRR